MPRQGSYVDNAMNRSLGRVGMSYGSAVHSLSSGSGHSGMSFSSGTYVDNSMNRSLGRVGMDYGTAVHSRSSGSGHSGMSSSSGTYVDNSMNRSLGRVGMDYGTAVHSRLSVSSHSGSTSSSGTYVDNAANRSLGRVGMALGTAVQSRSSVPSRSGSTSSAGTYVDNAANRSLGRVGMALGTAVQSRSSGPCRSGSTTPPGTYVDNAANRALGRVGMNYGTAVQSRSSGTNKEAYPVKSAAKTYVDNASNRALGRVEMPIGTSTLNSSASVLPATSMKTQSGKRTYTDNAYNRRLGRVGKELGTHVVSKLSSLESAPSATIKQQKMYVDNATNRKLNRVGMVLGSKPHSVAKKPMNLFPMTYPQIVGAPSDYDNTSDLASAYQEIECKRELAVERNDIEALRLCDQVEGIVNRFSAAKSIQRSHPPSWLKSGDVIDYSDLEIGDKVGGGGFGDAYFAIWKGETVCVKVLRVQRVREQKLKQFQSEVNQMSSLDHPAIVSFYGACIVTPKLAIVMEFFKNGSLYDAIHMNCVQFRDDEKVQLAEDMLSALEYIHDSDITHRDVKSSNVLLCDDQLHCKLGDFGLALKEETETYASVAHHSAVGTMKYSPLEVLEGTRLSVEQYKAVDVYSTALTILELMVEKVPFVDMNQHQVQRALKNNENEDLEIIDNFALKNLLARCLDRNPSNRPTAAQFKEQLP